MVSQLNNIKSFTANGATGVSIKSTGGVVKGIHITIAHATDVVYVLDGTNANGTTQFTVESDNAPQIPFINRTFANGIFLTFTGTTTKGVIIFE